MLAMGKRQVKLSEQIRRAVDASGLSRYAICKTLGIDQSAFSRFMHGTVGLTMAHLDGVAELLGLELKRPKGPGKAAKHGFH